MIIKNQTKNTILAIDAKVAKFFVDQSLGLNRKSNPRSLVLHTHFGIHTFFLKEAIDVIVLDSKNRVVKIKEIDYFFGTPGMGLLLSFQKEQFINQKPFCLTLLLYLPYSYSMEDTYEDLSFLEKVQYKTNELKEEFLHLSMWQKIELKSIRKAKDEGIYTKEEAIEEAERIRQEIRISEIHILDQ